MRRLIEIIKKKWIKDSLLTTALVAILIAIYISKSIVYEFRFCTLGFYRTKAIFII